MMVTEVKVFPVSDDKLKAFVSIVLDNCFMVNDIKVIEGKDGRFISMPSRRKRNGKFKDIAHPLNSETRKMLEGEILDEYEQTLNGGSGSGSERRRQVRQESRPSAVVSRPSVEDDGKTPAVEESVAAEINEASTLEEVTERHLSDSFWTS